MNTYHIWVDLAPGAKDMHLVEAIEAYLGHLRSAGTLTSWRIQRRKFGFGPPELGEFHIQIDFVDLTKMDEAFGIAAKRSGEVERMHAAVYSRVKNFRSGLFRDFPDPQREPD